MRISDQMRLRTNINDYRTSSKAYYNANAKLTSKLQIQHSYQDSGKYSDATRLEYELNLLAQAKETSTKASEFTKNTDSALGNFVMTLTNFKTKLIQAGNIGAHDKTSLDAIANDLEGFKGELINIANTSINGQFLFSGTALDVKPISADGTYNGNDQTMNAVIGANQRLPYNIDGKDLFLGRDNDYKKVSTTNVTLMNKREPLLDSDKKVYINATDPLYNMIGGDYRSKEGIKNNGALDFQKDFLPSKRAIDNPHPQTTFFMQGRKITGETFSSKFSLTATSTIDSLLDRIGIALGNTEESKVVEVTLNGSSQIEVRDKNSGSLLNDFSIFGLTAQKDGTDAITGGNYAAGFEPSDIEKFTSQAEIDNAIKSGNVHLTEFIKSPNLNRTDGQESLATDYDDLRFEKKDNIARANIPQVIRDSNKYADNSTRLVDVAGLNLVDVNGERLKDVNGDYLKPDLTKIYNKDGTISPANDRNLTMSIRGRDGVNYEAKINFVNASGANDAEKFPVLTIKNLDANKELYKGNIYKGEWDASPMNPTGKETIGKKVGANDLTYQQISDIVKVVSAGNVEKNFGNVVVNENLSLDNKNPADRQNITDAYKKFNEVLQLANREVDAGLDHRGRMVVKDRISSVSKIEVAMYNDKGANEYPSGVTKADGENNGSIFSFNGNDAITIDEASVDIFADIDEMIESVRNGTYRADSKSMDPRTSGIQGAIKRIDHLLDHIDKKQAIAGTYTNNFEATISRNTILSVNISSVKSEIIDADIGEVALELTQRNLGLQATLQATAKISQLSLLNYM